MYIVANCALGQYIADEVVILSFCINIKDKKYCGVQLVRFFNNQYRIEQCITTHFLRYTRMIIEANVKTTNIKKSMYLYNSCIKFAVVQS